MKVVEVSPMTNKVAKDSLTYFSARSVSPGDIVSISVRNKKHHGLVLAVSDLRAEKSKIRKADFAFKKIEENLGPSPFYSSFFESVRKTRDYFVGNTGQMINFFIPELFFENLESLAKPAKPIVREKNRKTYLLTEPLEKRLDFYNEYLRGLLEEKRSAFVILPTKNEVDIFAASLSENFDNVSALHSGLRKKDLLKRYKELVESTNPQIIVMTPSFLFLPKHDLGSVIIENEISSGYKTRRRPYFDVKTVAEHLSVETRSDFIMAGDLVSVESFNKEFDEKHIGSQTRVTHPKTIDMSDKESLFKKSFVLSQEIVERLRSKGRTFLFALRKGLATQVVCHDCGRMLMDGDEPLILQEKDGERFFRSMHSKKVFDTKVRCQECGGWNFDSLGIGTDTVREEITKHFPKAKIFQIDKDATPTEKKVKEVMEKFLAEESAILIGTEMALPHLREQIGQAAIVSFDSLFFIPSYKVCEKIFHIIHTLQGLSKEPVIVQTRQKIDYLLEAAQKGEPRLFYEKDLAKRKAFGYPPFGTVIKIVNKTKKTEAGEVPKLYTLLTPWNPTMKRFRRGIFIESVILLRLPKDKWSLESQEESLKNILSSLGPDFEVRIDPENLF